MKRKANMKPLKLFKSKLAQILTAIFFLVIFIFSNMNANAANDELSLNPLATVLATEGEISKIQENELLFSNRTYTFSASVPKYLLGKSFLLKDLSGLSATAKTSGWIYVLTEADGTSSQVGTLLSQGYEQICQIEKGVLSQNLKQSVILFGKQVEAGEKIQFGSWGLLIADFITSEDQLYEKKLALIESTDGILLPVKGGETIFANRAHVFNENIFSWLEGKFFLQKTDINSTTTFTVKSAGWVYILVESTNTKGVNEVLTETYGFDQIGCIASKNLSPTLTKSIFVYGKYLTKEQTVSFQSWGLVISASYATLDAESYEVSAYVEGGGQIFTDRPESHLFTNTVPDSIRNMPLIRGSLTTGSIFRAVSDGYVYIATPTEGSKSQYKTLIAQGYTIHSEISARELSSSIKENLYIMEKYIHMGETIEYGSWAITFAHLHKGDNDMPLSFTPPAVLSNPTDSKYLDGNRAWQGIPAIAKDEASGRLFASWYSGGEGEGSENFALLYTSTDDGNTWSGPIVAIDHEYPVRIFDPNLWVDPDGRLWWFWSQSFTKQDGVFGVWMMYTDNPNSENPMWSEPLRVANGVAMNDPIVLSSGEWLLSTAIWEGSPYVEQYSNERFSNVYISTDKGASWSYLGSVPSYENGRSYDENMIIEQTDGTLRMLIRTQSGIEESFSYDRGHTWTAAVDTNLTKVSSRFYIHTLRSGHQMMIYNNPEQNSTERSHLSVTLSLDGGKSWPYKFVIDERISTSYPDAFEDAEGNIYIIYDHGRSEHGEILMAKIQESDIIAGTLLNDASHLGKLVNNNISKSQSRISATALCLGTDLSMKYSLHIADAKLLKLGELSMHFTLNGTTIVCTNYETKGNEYIFRFSNIAPQQMTDLIQAVAYAGNTPIATCYDHSVKRYCKQLLGYEAEVLGLTDQAYEALKELITNLLHYGSAAQIYQSYRIYDLPTDDFNSLGVPTTELPDSTDYTQTESESESAYFTSVGLWFDNTNRLYINFVAKENARVVIKTGETVLKTYDHFTENTAFSPEIFATEYNRIFTFELYEDEKLVQILNFSVKSYVYSIQNCENNAMINLANRMYAYGCSAIKYKVVLRDCE